MTGPTKAKTTRPRYEDDPAYRAGYRDGMNGWLLTGPLDPFTLGFEDGTSDRIDKEEAVWAAAASIDPATGRADPSFYALRRLLGSWITGYWGAIGRAARADN